jgi:hypothetical protein
MRPCFQLLASTMAPPLLLLCILASLQAAPPLLQLPVWLRQQQMAA